MAFVAALCDPPGRVNQLTAASTHTPCVKCYCSW